VVDEGLCPTNRVEIVGFHDGSPNFVRRYSRDSAHCRREEGGMALGKGSGAWVWLFTGALLAPLGCAYEGGSAALSVEAIVRNRGIAIVASAG
jgi:hypothetical protein